MGKPNQYKASDFIKAIPGSGGIVSTIAARVGCAWHTAKKYIDTYPTVAKAYNDECEGILDLAESTVIKGIQDGDQTSAKWYLTMKGKRRGYAESRRKETIKIDLSKLTPEQLERIANGDDPIHVLATTGGGGT